MNDCVVFLDLIYPLANKHLLPLLHLLHKLLIVLGFLSPCPPEYITKYIMKLIDHQL